MAESRRNSEAGTIRCVIVTPETTALDTRARSVVLPLFDGRRGVAPGHAPFIGRLGVGEVTISGERSAAAEAARRVFVEGGFVEVGHDAVTVITQRAVAVEKIDASVARSAIEKLRSSIATGDEAIDAKMRAESAAREYLRAAERRRS